MALNRIELAIMHEGEICSFPMLALGEFEAGRR